MSRIFEPTEKNLLYLSSQILKGEVFGVPTETVYGLGASAFDAKACAKIFSIKNRPSFDPLIVHLPIGYPIQKVATLNQLALDLAAKFWPGPLTLVLPKKSCIPDIVTSGFNTVAIRIPRHPILQKLLSMAQTPLAAPSANPFGFVSPTTAQHVLDNLGSKIIGVLDGGPCAIGLESTIIDVRTTQPAILRHGAITTEELEAKTNLNFASPQACMPNQIVPGQISHHYSPGVPMEIRSKIEENDVTTQEGIAWVFFQKPFFSKKTPLNWFWLTHSGSMEEAAQTLFSLLRHLSKNKFSKLVVELAPPKGLGMAINDRLKRAAARETQIPSPPKT